MPKREREQMPWNPAAATTVAHSQDYRSDSSGGSATVLAPQGRCEETLELLKAPHLSSIEVTSDLRPGQPISDSVPLSAPESEQVATVGRAQQGGQHRDVAQMPILVEVERYQECRALLVKGAHEVRAEHVKLEVVDTHPDALSSMEPELGTSGRQEPSETNVLALEDRSEEVRSQHIDLGVTARPPMVSP